MAAKITKSSWFKNAAKSLGYGALSYMGENVAPYTFSTIEANRLLIDKSIEYIKSPTELENRVKNFIISTTKTTVDTAKKVKSNAISDLKTGKFINKERENELSGDDFGDLGFDDFDFGDEDFSFGDDSSDDVEFSANVSIESNIDKNNPMVKAVQAQTELYAQVAVDNAERQVTMVKAQISNDNRISEAMHAALGSINNNLGILINFNTNKVDGYIGSSLEYYKTSIQHMETISTELKKVSSYYEKLTNDANNKKRFKTNNTDIFGANNELSISDYASMVKQNIVDFSDMNPLLSGIKSALDMTSTAGGFESLLKSPLEFIPKYITKIIMPQTLTALVKSVDDTAKSFIPALLSKLGDKANEDDDGSVKGFLGKLFGTVFGLQKNKKFSIDTSSYQKGSISFDGITKKSIVEVIPTYLRKILSAVSGKGEMVYDYETGKFTSMKTIKENYDKELVRKSSMGYEGSGYVRNAATKILSDTNVSSDDRKSFNKIIDNFFVEITKRNKMFNPDNDEDYNDVLGDATQAQRQLLKSILQSMSERERMSMFGIDNMIARNNMSQSFQDMENKGHHVAINKFNNSDSSEFSIDNPLSKLIDDANTDKFGYKPIDYIRDIRDILLEGVGVWTISRQRPTIRRRPIGIAKIRNSLVNNDKNGEPPSNNKGKSLDEGIRNLSDDELKKMLEGTSREYSYDEEDGEEKKKKQKLPKALEKIRDILFGDETSQNALQKALAKGFEKVTNSANKIVDKINHKMYDIIFGLGTNKDDKEKKEPLLDRILNGIANKLEKFFGFLNEHFFSPIADFLIGDEGILTKIKESKFFDDIKNFGKKAGDWLFGDKVDGKREGGLFSDIANSLSDMGNQFKLFMIGKGKDVDGKEITNPDSVFGQIKKGFIDFTDNIKNWLSPEDKDKNKSGLWDDIKDSFKSGMASFSNMFFGVNREKDGKFTSKINTDDLLKTIKDRAPKSLAGGIIGGGAGILAGMGGFGILGSLFLGPMSGVVIGTATGFLSQSDKFKDWLFGDKVDGKRIGGFISKSTQDFVKEHKGALIGGASLGALKGLLGFGFLPSFIMGGPITGALTGLATSLLFKSEAFQNFLFGSLGEDGKRSGGIFNKISDKVNEKFNKEAFKNKAGAIGIGALGGLGIGSALGSFGILGSIGFGPWIGAISGIGLGLIATSEKWKERLFGKFDEDGNRTEYGLFGKLGMSIDANIMQPMKVKFTEWQFNIETWFEQDIARPFANALVPFREEFTRFKNKVSDFFVGIGEKLRIPEIIDGIKIGVTNFISKVGKSFNNIANKAISGIGKIAGSILSAPVKALDYIGEKFLIPKHMKEGLANIRKIIISNLVDSFKETTFYQKVFEPVTTKISKGIDWFKTGFTNVFDKVTEHATKAISTIFRTLGNAVLGIIKTPFQMLALPFKTIGKLSEDFRESSRQKADSNDLQGILTQGGNRGVVNSIFDLASTFLPGKVRRAAQWSEETGGASYVNDLRTDSDLRGVEYKKRHDNREAIKTQLRDILKSNKDIMSDQTLTDEEKNTKIKENRAKMNEIIDGSSEKVFGSKKFLERFVNKEEKADERADKKAKADEAKEKEKALKNKYGKSYTSQTKLEQDRFKMESETASSTKETAENTKESKNLLSRLLDRITEGIHVKTDESEVPESFKDLDFKTLIDKATEDYNKIKPSSKIRSNIQNDIDKYGSIEPTPEDIEREKKKIEEYSKSFYILNRMRDNDGKSEKDIEFEYLMKKYGPLESEESKSDKLDNETHGITASEIINRTETHSNNTGFSTSLIDEANGENRHDYLNEETFGTTAFEINEQHKAENALKERMSTTDKAMELIEAIKDNAVEHKNLFDGIFGKKGLITMGVLALLPLLMKFLKDPSGFLSGLMSGAGNFLSELLGFKDDDGSNTDVTGDTQLNSDAVAAVARGAGYATSKGLTWADNAYQIAKNAYKTINPNAGQGKFMGKVNEYITVSDTLKGSDDVAKEIYENALKESGQSGYKHVSSEAMEKATKEYTDKYANEMAEKAYKETVEGSGQKVAREAYNKTLKEASDNAAKEAYEKALSESGEKAAQKAAKNAYKETIDGSGKQLAQEAYDKALKETGESAAEKALKEATENAIDKNTKLTLSKLTHVEDIQKSSKSTLFTKFIELLKKGAANLGELFAKKFPKISGKMQKIVIEPIVKASSKLTDKVLVPFTAKIMQLFGKLGLTATGVGLVIDAGFAISAGVVGSTKASAANLFQVPQDAVDGTMKAISAALKTVVNFSWFFVIDLADDIIESVTGISILNQVATLLYKYIKSDDEEAIKNFDIAQTTFKGDFGDYTLAQQLMIDNVQKDEKGNVLYIDENGNFTTEKTDKIAYKDQSKVTESFASYNDRANKSGVSKFFEKTGQTISTGWKSIFGSKGNIEEYDKALEQKKALQLAVEQGLVDQDSEAYKLSMESIEKSLAKNKSYDVGEGFKKAGEFVVDKVKMTGDFIKDVWDDITKDDVNIFSNDYWTPPTDDENNPLSGFNKALFYSVRIATAPKALLLQAGVSIKKKFDKVVGGIKNVVSTLISENDALVSNGAGFTTAQYWTLPFQDDGENPITGFAACAFTLKRIIQIPLRFYTWIGRGVRDIFSGAADAIKSGFSTQMQTHQALSDYISNGGSVISTGYWSIDKVDFENNPLGWYLEAVQLISKMTYAPLGLIREAGGKIKNFFVGSFNVIKSGFSTQMQTHQALSDYISNGGSVISSDYWTIDNVDSENNPLSAYLNAVQFTSKLTYAPLGLFREVGGGILKFFKNIFSGIASVASAKKSGSDFINEGGNVFSKDYWVVENEGDTPISPFLTAMNFIGRLTYFPAALMKQIGIGVHETLLKNPTYRSFVAFGSNVKKFLTLSGTSEEDYWNAKKYGVDETSGFQVAFFNIARTMMYPQFIMTKFFDSIGEKILDFGKEIKKKGVEILDKIKGWFGGDDISVDTSDLDKKPSKSYNAINAKSRVVSSNYVLMGGEDSPLITNPYGSMITGLPNTGGKIQDILNEFNQPSKSGKYGSVRSTGKVHKGIDLTKADNTPIYSFTSGEVIDAVNKYRPNSGSYPNGPGYGNCVRIKDENGYIHIYGHLNAVNAKVGQKVNTGTQIGIQGHTGNSTGPHLHYEVRKNADASSHVDPLKYLEKYETNGNVNEVSGFSTTDTTKTVTTPGTGLLGVIEVLSKAQSDMLSPLTEAVTQMSGLTSNLFGTNSSTTTETISTPSSGSSSSGSTSVVGSSNAEKIWNYLTKTMGLNKYGAAGLMGNLQAESNLNPINLEGKYEKLLKHSDESYTRGVDNGSYRNFVNDKAGYGLAQWTYHSRKKNMIDFIKSRGLSIGDLGGQLAFLDNELSKSYSGLYNKLKSAPSLQTASDWVLKEFERPADQSYSVQLKRAGYGKKYLDTYGGEDIPISINNGYINKFSNLSNNRKFNYRLPIGGEDTNVTIPDKVYEVLDKIVNALMDIAKNTKSTSDNIEKIESKSNNTSNTAVMNQSTTNNNNPIYSAATNQRTNEKQKKYTIAKNIAMGIQ